LSHTPPHTEAFSEAKRILAPFIEGLRSRRADGVASSAAPRAAIPYVAAIDSLRAIAVIAVLIFHMHGPWLPGGYTGVDVFLVISGYVISRSMVELDTARLVAFAAAFYARRLRRILPALLACLLVTSLVTALFVPDAWLSDANHDTGRYAFWGLSNYFLMHSGNAYFAPRIEFNPYAHTWSLGVEEQFYLVFPLLFYAWLRWRTRASRLRFAGTVLLGLLLLASLGYSASVTHRDLTVAYYALPSRFWELAAGALLFQLHVHGLRMSRRRAATRFVQLPLSLGLVTVGFVFSRNTAFPFPWALAAVVGTLGVIDAATSDDKGAALWLGGPLLAWAGRSSYSLYLWHWPVYVLFRWTVGLETWDRRLAALSLVVGLSWISYVWIENPFRRGRFFRSARPGLIVAGALGCAVLSWHAANAVHAFRDRLSFSVTKDAAVWYPLYWSSSGEGAAKGCLELSLNLPIADQRTAQPSRRSGCRDGVGRTNLFVAGNSHAPAYITLLSKLSFHEPFNVRLYYRSECDFLPLSEPTARAPATCRSMFEEEVIKEIMSTGQAGDILFLPSLRLPRFGDQWAGYSVEHAFHVLRGEQARRLRQQAVEETYDVLRPLVQKGIKVIFEAPKPMFRAPAFRCSDWFNRGNPICAPGTSVPREYLLEYRKPVLEAMMSLRSRDRRISVWDPFDTLCPKSVCAAVVDGTPLFFDGDHLSGYANTLLYPVFVAFLRELQRD
jgi:peptidoglycan/LPS O-acetylase OafA/YrhL